MLTSIRLLSVGLCVVSLSACMIDGSNGTSTDYSSYQAQSSTLYPDGYDTAVNYSYPTESKKGVVVPESYHVGTYGSPTSSKDVDRTWVSSQNPQAYTIEIADDAKASHVASALQKAPKSEHSAEVQYQRNGQAAYKGLYGTYPSEEAAQQALSQLPSDIKQNASIKTWGNVQNNISE